MDMREIRSEKLIFVILNRVIKSMHIGVKLLYNHGGTADRDVTKGLLTPTVNDSG